MANKLTSKSKNFANTEKFLFLESVSDTRCLLWLVGQKPLSSSTDTVAETTPARIWRLDGFISQARTTAMRLRLQHSPLTQNLVS